MQNQYAGHSFFRICWDNLLTLIGLNLLFLLLSVPLITASASATALARSCQDIILGKGHPYKNFLSSFHQNLVMSLPIGILSAGTVAGLLYGTWFYAQMARDTPVLLVFSFFCLVCLYLCFCVGMIGFQIIARIHLPTVAVLKDAFILVMKNPRLLFTWLMIAFLVPVVTAWFFPRTIPIMLLLPCSVSCLATARGVTGIICAQLASDV